jgi:hypothetical protein
MTDNKWECPFERIRKYPDCFQDCPDIEQCKMKDAWKQIRPLPTMKNSTLNYPKHQHPHGVENTKPNDNRIWVCEECLHIFSDSELRNDIDWGHRCQHHPCHKGQRCESHLESFIPELKEKT